MFNSILSKLFKSNKTNNTQTSKVVCGCFNVTEQDIKDAVKNGASSFEDVQKITKVGTGCGACVTSNKAFVNDLLLQKKIDENQIICGCFKVTAQEVANAIKNGAKSFEEVQAITKIGTGCGKCVEGNKALVNYILSK
jgi:NAD(P)H-nitrite reductase large subunit